MRRIFLVVSLCAAVCGVVAMCVEDPRWFTPASLTLHVRLTGSDDNPHCGETAATACRTVKRAGDQVPDWWVAPVEIQVGPGTIAMPTQVWRQRAGVYTAGTVTKEGTITVRGACESPLATWAAPITGVAVPGRYDQYDFTIPGGWTGTIGEATHHARVSHAFYGTRYYVTRTSTSPTLRLVTHSSVLTPGSLCGYETVITSPDFAKYGYRGDETTNFPVRFAGMKFTGNTTSYQHLLLSGNWIGGPAQPNLNEVGILGGFFDYHNTVYSSGQRMMSEFYDDVYWRGCPQFRGVFGGISGLVTGPCQPSAQISFGIFNEDPPTYGGGHSVRSINYMDFEGQGACLKMHATTIRVGIDTGAGQGISCNNTDGEAMYLDLDLDSKVSFATGVAITGTVTKPTQIRHGSSLGPMSGGWQVVNSGAGHDFTVGTTVNVPLSSVPGSDIGEDAHVF